MSNFIKNLTVKVYPKLNTPGWDSSHTSENPRYSNSWTLEEGSTLPSISLDDLDNQYLFPETTYTVDVSGLDNYNNTVSDTKDFTTKQDYPAFSKVKVAHRETQNDGYTFRSESNVKDSNGDSTVDEDISTAKRQLNNDFLDINEFELFDLIDSNDKNAFTSKSFKTNSFQKISSSSEDNIYQNYYASNGNTLIPNNPTLIELDIFNKQLGIHEVDASLNYNSSVITASNISATSYNIEGSDYTIVSTKQAEFKPELEQDGTIHNFGYDNGELAPTNTFGIYNGEAVIDSSSKQNIWIGINTNSWNNVNEDKSGSIIITAKSKGKDSNNLSTSTLNFDFKTYAAPKIYVEHKDPNNNTFIVDDGTSVINVDDYSNITFTSDFSASVSMKYRIISQTAEVRPFLPLVNYNYDNNQNVISSTIRSFTAYSDYLFPFNGSSLISNVRRQTPFVIEAECNYNSNCEDLVAYNDSSCTTIYNSGASRHGWYTIGAAPTSNNGTINIVNEYYDEDNTYEQNIENSNIINNTGSVIYNQNLKNYHFEWPITPQSRAFVGNNSTHNYLEHLIPGKYYKFRATAANFCGTTSKEFIFKMKDPESCVFTSSISSPNSVPVTLTGSTNESTTFTVETGSPISGYATFSLGGGNEILNNTKIEVYNSNNQLVVNSNASETSWPNQLIETFSTSGQYTIKFTAPQYRIINGLVNPNRITHTYSITVTDTPRIDVITSDPTSVTTNSAVMNGRVDLVSKTSNEQGFIWSTTESDLTNYINNTVTSQVFTNFAGTTSVADNSASATTNVTRNKSLTGLTPGTTYYYAAYAVCDGDYVIGDKKTITTESLVPAPEISIDSITRTTGIIRIS